MKFVSVINHSDSSVTISYIQPHKVRTSLVLGFIYTSEQCGSTKLVDTIVCKEIFAFYLICCLNVVFINKYNLNDIFPRAWEYSNMHIVINFLWFNSYFTHINPQYFLNIQIIEYFKLTGSSFGQYHPVYCFIVLDIFIVYWLYIISQRFCGWQQSIIKFHI